MEKVTQADQDLAVQILTNSYNLGGVIELLASRRALGFAKGIEAAATRIEELGVNRDGTLDPVAKAVAANVRTLAKENSNDRP